MDDDLRTYRANTGLAENAGHSCTLKPDAGLRQNYGQNKQPENILEKPYKVTFA